MTEQEDNGGLEIIDGIKPSSYFMAIYGRPGIGKSTLASWAPDPFFIDVAGGLDRVDCKRSKVLKTWEEVQDTLRKAYSSSFKTIVVDEIGGLEEILVKEVLKKEPKHQTISAIPYGKGYEMLCQEWTAALHIFEALRENHKNVIFVGHDVVEKFQDPLTEDYDRYSLNIHKRSLTPFVGKMDAVIFAQFETLIKSRESSNKRRAIGGERRVLHTVNNAAFIAKNRFNLEPEEEFAPTFWTKIN